MMDVSRKKALVVNGSVPNRLLMSSYMYGAVSAGSQRPAGSVLRSVGRVTVPALTLGVVSAAVAIWAPGVDDRRDFFAGGRKDASGQTAEAGLREADAREGGSQASTRSLGPGWSIASLLTNGDRVPANAGSKELPPNFKAGPQTARVSDPAPLVGIQAPASETRLEVAPSSDQGERPLQESHLPIPEHAECLAPCDAAQGDLGTSARAVAYSSEAVAALDSASTPGPGLLFEVPQPEAADRAAGRFVASVNDAESQPLATDARLSEIATSEYLPLVADGEAPVVSAPSNAEPEFEEQRSPASSDESQRISHGSQIALADAPAAGTRPAVAEPRPGRIEEPSAKDTVTPGAQSFSVEPDRPAAADRLVETVSVATAGQDGTLGVSSVEIAEGDLVSIKLGDLISLFEDRLDRPLFVWMSSSMAAEKYVTPETLAAAGLAVSFDPARGQVVLTISD